jgi:hypothetical protein
MASSSANVQRTELEQLLQLQRSGILSTADFLRMSAEITKPDKERLEEVQSEFASGDKSDKSDKVFDPSFADAFLTEAMVRDLVKITPLRKMVPELLKELPNFLSAAKGFTVDHKHTDAFTKAVLGWWANNGSKFPNWAKAAQIVFSFTPNSAGAERVFSLLKLCFGDARMSALADIIQASLMLRYNKRSVGHAS